MGANYLPITLLFQIGGNVMNKDDFFEAVKSGVLENLKKTDETLEATINKVNYHCEIVFLSLCSL